MTDFTQAELDAISSFVAGGGSLFLITEGDGPWLNRPALNDVGGQFGINWSKYDTSGYLNLADHEITQGIHSVSFQYGSFLSGASTPLGTLGLNTVMGVKNNGAGRVVLFGDCNTFDDQGYLYSGDHLQLALNIFLWLSTKSWLRVTPISGITPAGASSNITALFDASGLNGGDYRM